MDGFEVHIDAATWETASDERRAEWETIRRDLAQPGVVAWPEGAARLDVAVEPEQIALVLRRTDGTAIAEASLARDLLADVMREYADTVRQLADADASGLDRIEALDMAKKVTHDQGARLVRRALRDFGFSTENARKVFTLLFSLRFDTTRLTGVYGHRRIR